MTYLADKELEDKELADVVLLFSMEQAENFFKSLVWLEIVRTVNERLRTNSIEMEEAISIEALRIIQGDSRSCRFFLEQPRLIMDQLEEQLTETAAKKEEGK